MNKAFTELELQHFLRNVANEKFSLLFRYQAFLGLRVGEVCKLHLSNIDFDKREMTIKSEKSRKLDSLIIPIELFRDTVNFINKNSAAVKAARGFIFFKENNNNHNCLDHLDQNYVRKIFRECIVSSGLDMTYGSSDENYGRKERSLHRLTTHSLRHYAITRFSKSTNGNVVLTSRFARHSSPTTTMNYIRKDSEELYKNIGYAFDSSGVENIKKLTSKLNSQKP